jgi:hypothetical protein
MSRKHMVESIGVAKKNAAFAMLVGLAKQFEAQASFSTTSTGLLYLEVAQMPRFPDLAIFVVTDRQNRLLYPLLRMRARGSNLR